MDYQGFSDTEFVSKIRVERRKAQKPRIEKLRRDRINGSLNEIKHLVLEALNKDTSRYSKMEKADILEMTVHFLKGAQSRNIMHGGIQSRVEHTSEIHDNDCEERHLPPTPRNPRYNQDKLLVRMNPDILPTSAKPVQMVSHPMSPFASSPMVAMAAQPTIVWLPYPSPPPSPTEENNGADDVELKPTSTHNHRNGFLVRNMQHLPLTPPSSGMLPLWRPW